MSRSASTGVVPRVAARGRAPQRHSRRGRRSLLAAGVLLIAALAATAWFTLPRWYSTWMPAQVGKTAFPLDHVDAVRAGADRHGLDPALVAAVIYVESGFDAAVRSSSGAVGLMQVLPSTANEIAQRTDGYRFTQSDLRRPRVNVLYGCYYLRRLLQRYQGSVVCALAAYNAGAGNVDQWRAESGRRLSPGVIPFAETRAYVQQVLRARAIYRHIYGPQLAVVGATASTAAR